MNNLKHDGPQQLTEKSVEEFVLYLAMQMYTSLHFTSGLEIGRAGDLHLIIMRRDAVSHLANFYFTSNFWPRSAILDLYLDFNRMHFVYNLDFSRFQMIFFCMVFLSFSDFSPKGPSKIWTPSPGVLLLEMIWKHYKTCKNIENVNKTPGEGSNILEGPNEKGSNILEGRRGPIHRKDHRRRDIILRRAPGEGVQYLEGPLLLGTSMCWTLSPCPTSSGACAS